MALNKMKIKESKFIEIYLHQYRMTVLVSWENSPEKIKKYVLKRKVSLSDGWVKDFLLIKNNASGCCMKLGEPEASDVFVWLKERPRKASQYGVLYHELFHAVDDITESRNLHGEKESRAFLYEYLANECNRKLWV